MSSDHANWKPIAHLQRWDRTEDFEAGLPCSSEDIYEGNLLLNAGITRLNNLLIGAGGQAFNAANARLVVGDSSTGAVASQTDIQASTNKYYKLVDSITNSAQTITAVATYGTSIANFAWQEWGIDNGTADSATTGVAPMLNRKVVSMGTKASGATWVLTVTISIA